MNARFQYAAVLLIISGLSSVGLGIGAKKIGVTQLFGQDPIMAFWGPIMTVTGLWAMAVVLGIVPTNDTSES